MTVLLIAFAAIVAAVAHGTPLFVPAVVDAVLAFWANGVLHNYSPAEAQAAPDWAALLSLLTALAALGLLVAALVAH